MVEVERERDGRWKTAVDGVVRSCWKAVGRGRGMTGADRQNCAVGRGRESSFAIESGGCG